MKDNRFQDAKFISNHEGNVYLYSSGVPATSPTHDLMAVSGDEAKKGFRKKQHFLSRRTKTFRPQ